ncbi:MAG: ATP-binding protein [Deltaproteobacteria bacterium]|nr:MAG: ATP-binding protein [Deltaproteobacteria bacterium]
MPHSRKRHVLNLLLKKLSFSPIVSIQGPRQSGKSFLVRELLPKSLSKKSESKYMSFDAQAIKDFASTNPDTFLEQQNRFSPVILDEAQKVSGIFDAIKLRVDNERRPGSYILLGSTEFSHLTKVRESLTGRMSRLRLYPMNMAETMELPPNSSRDLCLVQEKPRVSRSDYLHFLERGGFPGIFAVRSQGERESLIKDWIDLIVQRDIHQIPGIKLDSELCGRILYQIAVLETPSAGDIAKALRKNPRSIKKHLEVLETLFVIKSLSPHTLGFGKKMYFLCDPFLAHILGSSFLRKLETAFLLEQWSQRSYRDDRESQLFFYQTNRGSRIQLLIETHKQLAAVKIYPEEKIDERELEVLIALQKKSLKPIRLMGLTSLQDSHQIKGVRLYPWESIC